MRILKTINLTASTKLIAQYRLQLAELDPGNGFVVKKQSGGAGSRKVSLSWHFTTLEMAELKFAAVLNEKTSSKGRQYEEASEMAENRQLELLLQ